MQSDHFFTDVDFSQTKIQKCEVIVIFIILMVMAISMAAVSAARDNEVFNLLFFLTVKFQIWWTPRLGKRMSLIPWVIKHFRRDVWNWLILFQKEVIRRLLIEELQNASILALISTFSACIILRNFVGWQKSGYGDSTGLSDLPNINEMFWLK